MNATQRPIKGAVWIRDLGGKYILAAEAQANAIRATRKLFRAVRAANVDQAQRDEQDAFLAAQRLEKRLAAMRKRAARIRVVKLRASQRNRPPKIA